MIDRTQGEVDQIVLVHGAWHGGWCWDATAARLRDLDFRVTVVEHLPSTTHDPNAGLRADATFLSDLLNELDGPAVLVGHSYAGMVLSELAGSPRVAHAVYIAAFAPTAGASLMHMAQGVLPEWVVVSDDAEFTSVSPEHAIRVMASNAPTAEVAREHVSRLVSQSVLSGVEPSSTTGWGVTPVTYVLTERDEAVPAFGQEIMAAGLGVAPIRIDAAHFPMYSDLDFVVNVIVEAAEGGNPPLGERVRRRR